MLVYQELSSQQCFRFKHWAQMRDLAENNYLSEKVELETEDEEDFSEDQELNLEEVTFSSVWWLWLQLKWSSVCLLIRRSWVQVPLHSALDMKTLDAAQGSSKQLIHSSINSKMR